MPESRAVVAGRRGGHSPRRPARASTGTLAATLGALLLTGLAFGGPGTAGAQDWRPSRGARPVAREGVGGLTDSIALAAVADSLASAARGTPAAGGATAGGTTAGTATAQAAVTPVAAASAATARFRSERDSVAYEETRAAAERDTGLRIVVSLADRELRVVNGVTDTLLVADVAIGVDTVVEYGTKSWRFETPRGRRTVLRKQANPVWIPPEWHYVEVATKRNLKLARLRADRAYTLLDGSKLVVRDRQVALLNPDGTVTSLPPDEELVFDGTVFIPPFGTRNRQIPGELGRFKMELGDGYMLHGTPHEDTIGTAATHGCVRLYDEDIEWLYGHVPKGTPVYIF